MGMLHSWLCVNLNVPSAAGGWLTRRKKMTQSNYSSRYYSYVGVKFLTVGMRRTNDERFALGKELTSASNLLPSIVPFYYYRRFVDEIFTNYWVQQIKVSIFLANQ